MPSEVKHPAFFAGAAAVVFVAAGLLVVVEGATVRVTVAGVDVDAGLDVVAVVLGVEVDGCDVLDGVVAALEVLEVLATVEGLVLDDALSLPPPQAVRLTAAIQAAEATSGTR